MPSLHLFTTRFPYGTTEAFLESEIQVLSREFDKVKVYPLHVGESKRAVPSNVEIITQTADLEGPFKSLLSYLLITIKVFVNKQLKQKQFRKDFRENFNLWLSFCKRSHLLNKYLTLEEKENDIFYTYWLDEWATSLSILKSKKQINTLIGRAHRFDLYEERRPRKYIPFRKFEIDNIDKLVLISQDGYDYIRKKFQQHRDKFIVSRLGTQNDNYNYQTENAQIIHILTLSYVVEVKRLHLIIDILKHVNVKVKWTHIGDGPLLNKIRNEAKVLPTNIQVNFLGEVSNREVLEYLNNTRIDVLCNLSESEGLPVSMMEAISYGIPIFATDAGGTKEIVSSQTGHLFPIDFEPLEFATYLNNFKRSKYNSRSFRDGIRQYWEINYKSQNNYKKFVEILKSNGRN